MQDKGIPNIDMAYMVKQGIIRKLFEYRQRIYLINIFS